MQYLVIKSSDYPQITSYQMTSDCNEPRLAVGGSYIPLTNTGGDSSDLKVKDNNGNTYRAMEYKSSSSSSSVKETTGYSGVSSRISYYQTTLDNPSGLSSVTNLTRSSIVRTDSYTGASVTAYSGLSSSKNEYYTTSIQPGNMSYITNLTKSVITRTELITSVSTSAYAGSSTKQSDYYTSSTAQANMSNITNLTASSSESASMMTWV